ncbi:hypothetical protein SAMN05192563_105215 [Paraburkholderia aspalathi]|uniref:Uncharacterized protein n=1 Tax=Paraburkholderia aspalathi TaxID=1324617 RepID=A0A1I7EQY0_9BURK|nr:hypothetical protein SAMN05192563_105215 [Paraburkholderia aspalathi]
MTSPSPRCTSQVAPWKLERCRDLSGTACTVFSTKVEELVVAYVREYLAHDGGSAEIHCSPHSVSFKFAPIARRNLCSNEIERRFCTCQSIRFQMPGLLVLTSRRQFL